MRFKEFLLKENDENISSIKIGDILTSLQTIYEDSGVMSRKDIDKYLTNIVNEIRPLLKTKLNLDNLKVIQKVAINLMKYLDPQVPNANISPRDLIYSCIKELESLISGEKSVVNKLYKKENDKNISPPENNASISKELKSASSNMKTTTPPNPGMETGIDNDKSPPLSGDGQRTLNVF